MTTNNTIKAFALLTLFFFAFEISFMEIELDFSDVKERGSLAVIIQSCLQSSFVTTGIIYIVAKIKKKLKNNS